MYDGEPHLYYEDACVVPERLDGKCKQEGVGFRDGPPYQRRGSLQLWQFLVTLLDDPSNSHFIAWTGRGLEFKLIEPEEVSLQHVIRGFVWLYFLYMKNLLSVCACLCTGGQAVGNPEEQACHEL